MGGWVYWGKVESDKCEGGWIDRYGEKERKREKVIKGSRWAWWLVVVGSVIKERKKGWLSSSPVAVGEMQFRMQNAQAWWAVLVTSE